MPQRRVVALGSGSRAQGAVKYFSESSQDDVNFKNPHSRPRGGSRGSEFNGGRAPCTG